MIVHQLYIKKSYRKESNKNGGWGHHRHRRHHHQLTGNHNPQNSVGAVALLHITTSHNHHSLKNNDNLRRSAQSNFPR